METIALKDLVLVGGGHAHVQTIKMFGMQPMPGVTVTLVSRDIETPYSGMIPGFVAGKYSREECHIDLRKLCSFAGVRLLHVEASDIDLENKRLHFRDNRPPIRFDVLSLDIGITPKTLSTSFSLPNITAVKPIDRFARRWDIILERIMCSDNNNSIKNLPVRIIIVGGGGGGTELSFAVHTRLRAEMKRAGKDPNLIQVTVVSSSPALLCGHNSAVQSMVLKLASLKGIRVVLDTEIVNVGKDDHSQPCLVSKHGSKFPFDEAIWCTQAVGQSWVKESGLETTEDGFVCVQPTLESVSHKDVFACGDIAHLVATPRPKAGVFAVRAGPPLTRNLRRRLLGESLEAWEPQEEFLGIISTFGDGASLEEDFAVASKGPLALQGSYLWKLKDKIDVEFMRLFQDLPDREEMMKKMAHEKKRLETHRILAEAAGSDSGTHSKEYDDDSIPLLAKRMGEETLALISKSKMRCGGCGSKVGSQVLSRALKRVRAMLVSRGDVVAGIGGKIGDDAAIVKPPVPPMEMVHTIDYFRSFISDPFVFGQVSANHALSDVHAMNGDPQTALALCVVPYGPEEKVEDALVQMLAGCMDVLKREGCALVGGHTSEGAEPAFGLSVNGVVSPDRVLCKGPLRIGCSIILTKGLGTGTILAADMRARARGQWVEGAISSMLQSNGPASKILQRHDCFACTDVTGFGFLGHLIEMIQYGEESEQSVEESNADQAASLSELAAEVYLDRIPALDGAVNCVQMGVLSSLQPQNIRCARAVANVEFGATKAVYPLLYDPQTAGGLLACVPDSRVDDCLRELRESGYSMANLVGRVIPRDATPYPPLVWLR